MHISQDYASVNMLQAYTPAHVPQSSNVTATREAVTLINESELLGFDRELRFSTDPQSRLGIVQVLNRSTGEVIVQLPSEFALNLAENLRQHN